MRPSSPTVSIIIPLYNAVERVERCLGSIIAQTLDSLEVIIVDDHGSDGSIDAARRITDSYRGPIEFIYGSTPVNSGPGFARNVGIDLASGKYIAFVDADDSIAPEFCSQLVDSAERNSSDLCFCKLEMLDEAGRTTGVAGSPPVRDGEFSGKMRSRFLTTYVTHFTTFLYKRSLFQQYHIHFPNGRIAEDSAMLCCALLCCRRISQVDRVLYRYHRHRGSLSTAADGSSFDERLSSMNTMMDAVRSNGWYEADKEEIDFIYIKKGYLMGVLDLARSNPPAGNSELKDLLARVRAMIPSYRSNVYLKRHPLYMLMDAFTVAFPSLAMRVMGRIRT